MRPSWPIALGRRLRRSSKRSPPARVPRAGRRRAGKGTTVAPCPTAPSADPATNPAAAVPSPRTPATGSAVLSDDERRLHQLGYAQELRRNMSGFSNFAVSFTIISILSGCLTLYGFGMNTGGPVMIVWGWPIVGILTLFVGLAMAE